MACTSLEVFFDRVANADVAAIQATAVIADPLDLAVESLNLSAEISTDIREALTTEMCRRPARCYSHGKNKPYSKYRYNCDVPDPEVPFATVSHSCQL